MSTDQNKAIVHRYFDERWKRRNGAVIDELLGAGIDLEDARQNFETMHAAIKDFQISMSDFIAEGRPSCCTMDRHRHPPGRTDGRRTIRPENRFSRPGKHPAGR